MSSIQLAFLCLAGMIVLMGLRVPIAVALGVTSFVGIWALRGLDTALKLSGSTPFEFAASWNLSAIPMFLLMGSIAYRCGLTTSLFDAARLWLSRLPGGLAVAANFAVGAVCRGLGLLGRDRGRDGPARDSGNAALPLRSGAGHRDGGRGRNAGIDDPAQHRFRDLRLVHRNPDRQVADGRRFSRPAQCGPVRGVHHRLVHAEA